MSKGKLGRLLGGIGTVLIFVFIGGDSGVIWCPWGLVIATLMTGIGIVLIRKEE